MKNKTLVSVAMVAVAAATVSAASFSHVRSGIPALAVYSQAEPVAQASTFDVSAADASFSVGDTATAYIFNSTRTMYVTGTGDVTGNELIQTSGQLVANLVIDEGITYVGKNAFANLTGLQTIQLPDSLVKFGNGVFRGCSVLTTVTNVNIQDIDECGGNNAAYSTPFRDCPALKTVTFSPNCTKICNRLFQDCAGLTNVTFADSIASIGDYAFCNTNISGESGELRLPDSCTYLGNGVFQNCKSIKSVTNINVSDDAPGNGNNAAYNTPFYKCDNITTASFKEGCTGVGSYLFYGNTSLTTVNWVDSITSIGEYAFYNTSLGKLTDGVLEMPDSITQIKDCSFGNCAYITSVTNIGNLASCNELISASWSRPPFYKTPVETASFKEGCTYVAENLFESQSSLKTINFSSTITEIKYQAFQNCTGLESVTLTDNIATFGAYVFCGCTNLTEVNNIHVSKLTNSDQKPFGTKDTKLTTLRFGEGATVVPWNFANGVTSLTTVELPSTMTKLDGYCFYNTGIASINLPKSVTTLGRNCLSKTKLTEITIRGNAAAASTDYPPFANCSLLTSMTFVDGVTKVGYGIANGCTTLTEINIADTVTSIDGYAMCNTGITSLTIPKKVTSLGNYAIADCKNLTEVNIVGNVTANSNRPAFNGCAALTTVRFKDGVTVVNGGVVQGLKSLTTLELADSITAIKADAFNGCSGITGELRLPDSLTQLGSNTFYGCTGITSVTNMGTITSCGSESYPSFNGCTGLTTVSYKEGAISTPAFLFLNCSNLKTVNFVDSITKIGDSTFKNTGLEGELRLPDSCTQLDYASFYGCTGITSVTNMGTITSCGNSRWPSFGGCTGITTVVFKDGATSIPSCLFINCTGLNDVTFPDSMSTIYSYAFEGCSSLVEFTIPDKITSIESHAFKLSDMTDTTVHTNSKVAKAYDWNGDKRNVTFVSDVENNYVISVPATVQMANITGDDYVGKYTITAKGTLVDDSKLNISVGDEVIFDSGSEQVTGAVLQDKKSFVSSVVNADEVGITADGSEIAGEISAKFAHAGHYEGKLVFTFNISER